MRELTGDEIADVLGANRVGVLALDGGAFPYPLPVNYGYDAAEDLFVMHLEGDEDSYKRRCLDMDDRAGFLVYEETGSGVWRSVVLRGTLVETTYQAAESAFAALARNAGSTPNPAVWIDAAEVTPYELDIHDRTGRAFDITTSATDV